MEATDPPRPGAKRILIVEDNELNMKLLNDVLEAYGYEVIQAREGGAALTLAKVYRPDLILMDLQLPDISGLDAVRRLKAAVTAFAMAGDERNTLESGCDGYVAKRIMLGPFLQIVESFIGTAGQLS